MTIQSWFFVDNIMIVDKIMEIIITNIPIFAKVLIIFISQISFIFSLGILSVFQY